MIDQTERSSVSIQIETCHVYKPLHGQKRYPETASLATGMTGA